MPRRKKHPSLQSSVAAEIESKLLERSAFSLSNAELLALLLSSREVSDPLQVAKKLLLETGNSLDRLSKTSLGRLSSLPYIGTSNAYLLCSALELARRLEVERNQQETNIISNAYDVKKLMKAYLSELPHEEFWILLLDEGKHLLNKHQISMGSTSESSIDTKIIFRHVLSEPSCTSVILVHNHPSGQLRPSPSDISLTHRILVAARFLGIRVLDHVIYTKSDCFSLEQAGLLELPTYSSPTTSKQQKSESILPLA